MYYFLAFHIWTKFCHIMSKDCDPDTSISAGFLSQLSVQAVKPPGCQPPWVQCGHEELSLFLGCHLGCGNYDATPRPDAAIKSCRVLVGTQPLSSSTVGTLPPHRHLCVLTTPKSEVTQSWLSSPFQEQSGNWGPCHSFPGWLH